MRWEWEGETERSWRGAGVCVLTSSPSNSLAHLLLRWSRARISAQLCPPRRRSASSYYDTPDCPTARSLSRPRRPCARRRLPRCHCPLPPSPVDPNTTARPWLAPGPSRSSRRHQRVNCTHRRRRPPSPLLNPTPARTDITHSLESRVAFAPPPPDDDA